MKQKNWMLIGCTVCLVCLLFSSCRDHGALSDRFHAGETVTPEKLLEISAELATSTETSDHTELQETDTGILPDTETLPLSTIVYWLESGSVYHTDTSCRHIAHAEEEQLCRGTILDALEMGKERICTACASSDER